MSKHPIRFCTRWLSSARTPGAGQGPSGFTLVELLVGVVLGSLVLGALGGAVLVSQMRVSASIRRDLASKDALNRAVALIRSDISAGSQVQVAAPTHLYCPRGLYITRPGYRYVCYRTSSTASFAATSYSGSSERPWIGSCILYRDGPMYKFGDGVGDLDTSSVATQVILDQLEIVSGSCLGSFLMSSSGGGATIGRDVDVTIRQTIDSANPARVTTFSARSGYNPLYMRGDYGQTDVTRITGACGSGVRHIAFPPSTSISIDQTCRNFYYLPNAYSTYTIQSGCSYTSCTVNGTALAYADLLIFADREIRP